MSGKASKLLGNQIVTPMLLVLLLSGCANSAQTGHVTSQGVKLREGPSTSTRVIKILKPGTEVEIGTCLRSGWCLVIHERRHGFVLIQYIKVHNPRVSSYQDLYEHLKNKRVEIFIAGAITLILFLIWILARSSSLHLFFKTAVLLAVCGLAVPVMDLAFRLSLLYSVIVVALALTSITALMCMRRK